MLGKMTPSKIDTYRVKFKKPARCVWKKRKKHWFTLLKHCLEPLGIKWNWPLKKRKKERKISTRRNERERGGAPKTLTQTQTESESGRSQQWWHYAHLQKAINTIITIRSLELPLVKVFFSFFLKSRYDIGWIEFI